MSLPHWIMTSEVLLLKAPAGLELPPLEDRLSDESLRQFQSLSPDDQRRLRNDYASHVLWRAGIASQDPNDTVPLDILEVCGHGPLTAIKIRLPHVAQP